MQAKHRLDFRKTSLVIAILYASCVAVLLTLYIRKFYPDAKLIKVIVVWIWAVGAQFVLFQYVTRFVKRWAQLISLLLQLLLFSLSLHNYVVAVFLVPEDVLQEPIFLFLPIWHYVTIAIVGLVMKIIESY